MAKKPRKKKTDKQPEVAQEPIPETSSVPRLAILMIFGVVLLMLGVTVGVVIDVVSRPATTTSPPSPTTKTPSSPEPVARPNPYAPPPRIEAPKPPSIFDEGVGSSSSLNEPLSGTTPLALNAVPSDAPASWPVVAIVIDDMGLDRNRTESVLQLPGPITVSYLTYAGDLAEQVKVAREAGHEVMAHIPMEPTGNADPGPGALTTSATADELRARMEAYLNGWSGYVGVNNHMGSKLTSNAASMEVVMSELRSRGLMWLDSRTGSGTVGEIMAESYGVPHVGRDVFLDNEDDEAAIAAQLAKVETVAQQQGYAVAIGHPRDATVAALSKWLETLEGKGIALVPVTEVLRRKSEARG